MEFHEEWEFLPENGSPSAGREAHFNPTGVFHVDYFTAPSQAAAISGIEVGKDPDDQLIEEEAVVEDVFVPPVTVADDEDVVFQIVFEEWKGSEESPESDSEIMEAGLVQCEDKQETFVGEYWEQQSADSVVVPEEDEAEQASIQASRWRSRGIGALCSVGMAAASLLVLVWGGNQGHSQISANDKRIDQVQVLKQPAEMGALMTSKASISFGGKVPLELSFLRQPQKLVDAIMSSLN